MTQKDKETTSRRDFLKLAGTAAPAAAVTVLASGQQAEAAAEPDLQSTRLQDTAQTRAYFDSARF
ncbi:twin-arginine translocation pathway signal protein [Phaeobacter gallaeciensis]|uniref:Twin-arginine translocation pathway signal protein n=2 Tax=Roseobacteraceae TaxID=2854170 RepID=A0A366WWT1_9RHOB|nr:MULTISPECIES: twin-arginine translocation signal domain-containing protein [Roseobacteraceae]MBT3143804.1 twin-arginine translocation signal domain-containing protein [Falsiruegeria litorea]MBT8169531.1 twin-arginine translocation signal domain-containing protein [Falsiruegeria litorea]RBW53557.1 twin-arginine translocation pathway signal protein [Phaeobacter gallaeciensis]